MSIFAAKLAKKIADNGGDGLLVARSLPLPMKIKLAETIQSDQNKALWDLMKRGPSQSGSTLGAFMYVGLLAAESGSKKAKDAFLDEPDQVDIEALKCKVLGCKRQELVMLEMYLWSRPALKAQLIREFKSTEKFLSNLPPFSLFL